MPTSTLRAATAAVANCASARLRICLLALALLPAGLAFGANEGVYTLYRDGEAHAVKSIAHDGEDLLSLRDLARALGGTFRWEAARKTAVVELQGSRLEIRPEAGKLLIDGQALEMSRPARILQSRMYVAPEFVQDVLVEAVKRAVALRDRMRATLGTSTPAPDAERLAEVEVRSLRDYTRILVRCPGSSLLPYTLNTPRGRIVLRVQADNLEVRDPELLVGDGAVESISYEEAAGRATFSVELGPDYRDHQTAVLRDPFRVVIDVYRRRPYTGPPDRVRRPEDVAAGPEAEAPAVGAAGQSDGESRARDLLQALRAESEREQAGGEAQDGAVAAPPPPPPSGRTDGRIRTIVIDPGHGGSAAGAKGPTELLEKDVTLDLGRELARTLERNLGVRVVLTRTADVDLSLSERTGIANHEKADLFISIHANGSLRRNARGAETYFLSRHATDDEARTLAALENDAVGGDAQALAGTDIELILWSLAQTQYLQESQRLGEIIQGEFNRLMGVTDRGVKQAPLTVLVGATMPAVLIEVGFITNPAEEKLLRDPEYRTRIVTAIFNSVLEFKKARETTMGALRARPE